MSIKQEFPAIAVLCLTFSHLAGNKCAEITVPENAHLDFGGNDWECDKPYSKRSGRCISRND